MGEIRLSVQGPVSQTISSYKVRKCNEKAQRCELRTIFNIIKKTILNYPKSAGMDFSRGPKKELETAVVNEPSVFEPLKFYCMYVAEPMDIIGMIKTLVGKS